MELQTKKFIAREILFFVGFLLFIFIYHNFEESKYKGKIKEHQYEQGISNATQYIDSLLNVKYAYEKLLYSKNLLEENINPLRFKLDYQNTTKAIDSIVNYKEKLIKEQEQFEINRKSFWGVFFDFFFIVYGLKILIMAVIWSLKTLKIQE